MLKLLTVFSVERERKRDNVSCEAISPVSKTVRNEHLISIPYRHSLYYSLLEFEREIG